MGFMLATFGRVRAGARGSAQNENDRPFSGPVVSQSERLADRAADPAQWALDTQPILHAHYDYTLTDPATKAPVREIGNWIAVYVRQPDGRMAMKWDIAADLPPIR